MNKSHKIWLAIIGILFIALGIICFCRPTGTLFASAWLIGTLTLASGILTLIFTLRTQLFLPNSGTRMLSALLQIFLGILFLANPVTLTLSLPLIFAFWVMIEGIILAINSFDYKRVGYPYWWSFLIFGILATALGIAGLRNPADAGKWLSTLIGLGLVMIGCAHFGALTGIKHFEKALDNAGRTVDIQ